MSEIQSTLLTTKQLGEKLGISVATIERWRSCNKPNQPPYMRLGGGAIRYCQNDVEHWLEINTVRSEGEGNDEQILGSSEVLATFT